MNPAAAETLEELKARGAFYTPPEITAFLSAWAIRDADDKILEPACGDGAFIAAAAVRFQQLGVSRFAGRIFGVELAVGEAEKSRRHAPTADIRVSSFFDVSPADLPTVDAVIGNPPYIRYHGFSGEDRRAGLARAAEQGVKLTQLASSWAHFVVHSIAFLPRRGGRLALVLPAELLHTDYAEPVRDLLVERFKSVIVIAFDRNVFEGAQVDAVLILASDDDDKGMRLIRVHDAAAVTTLDLGPALDAIARPHSRRWSATIDADAERVYADLSRSDRAVRLGSLASVDIGAVTGNNGFFVMSAKDARARRLPESVLTPIVSRPGDISGLRVKPAETSLLLDLRNKPEPIEPHILSYLAQGVAGKVNEGYKCRTRKPWYAVPLPTVKPHAFLPYMNHHAPRLIVNGLGCWSTNLIHGVTFFPGHRDVRAIVAAMLSSITWLSAEIEGRAYGGGVLKMETKEAERLLVPVLADDAEAALLARFDELDRLVRAGDHLKASVLVDEILDVDHERFMVAREVFRARRLRRKGKVA